MVPLAPVALVLMIRVPAVVVGVMPTLSDAPPHGILADSLQADRTRLFLLRGCAKLLPHDMPKSELFLSLSNDNLHATMELIWMHATYYICAHLPHARVCLPVRGLRSSGLRSSGLRTSGLRRGGVALLAVTSYYSLTLPVLNSK